MLNGTNSGENAAGRMFAWSLSFTIGRLLLAFSFRVGRQMAGNEGVDTLLPVQTAPEPVSKDPILVW